MLQILEWSMELYLSQKYSKGIKWSTSYLYSDLSAALCWHSCRSSFSFFDAVGAGSFGNREGHDLSACRYMSFALASSHQCGVPMSSSTMNCRRKRTPFGLIEQSSCRSFRRVGVEHTPPTIFDNYWSNSYPPETQVLLVKACRPARVKYASLAKPRKAGRDEIELGRSNCTNLFVWTSKIL